MHSDWVKGPNVRTGMSSKPCMLVLLAADIDVHRVLLQTLLVRSLQRCRHGRRTNTGYRPELS